MAHRLPTEIQPGQLRHRIQIVAPTGGQGAMGGISQNPSQWTPVWTCWASIEAFTGVAALSSQEFISTSTHWITIRHPHGLVTITSQMLVWFSGRTFQVNAVLNPTEQNKLLVLVVTEINQSQQEAVTPSAP